MMVLLKPAWSDYTDWKIFVTDNNDEDGDGTTTQLTLLLRIFLIALWTLGNGWFQHEVLELFLQFREDWYTHRFGLDLRP